MTKRSTDGGREKVVAAARMLFEQRGFHQTAMSELSERAGVSVGQIYRLFASKSEMILAIIHEDTEAKLVRFGLIRADLEAGRITAREALRRLAAEALAHEQQALTFEILAEGFRNPRTGDEIGQFCDRYRGALSALIRAAAGEMEPGRLAAAEEVLMGLLFGLGNRALCRPRLGPEETADFAADMMVAMLRG
ncbi:TetR/AcrR family transcriptional regulator [Novosphingobium sp. 9]|uniref:TetR/AcrR family transcriptional regulator n=1 Tax=Novosphingobium sp. 9 TaxID=2025349 RepID=UPI0021B52690|nr:TetR/AcrR family transcriptional regulator [Novosphingobium sp. 9]